MDDLRTTTDEEVTFRLTYALRFDLSGKALNKTQTTEHADIVASRLLRHLQRSNYVILKKPPGPWSSTSFGGK